jgi:hypothetical protein
MNTKTAHPPLEAREYRGGLRRNSDGSYDFIVKYYVENAYYEPIESGNVTRVPFDAIIRDLPKDIMLDHKEGSFLKSFSLSRGEIPDSGTYVINFSWLEVAELCEAGKVEIEGRDTRKDAVEARRKNDELDAAVRADELWHQPKKLGIKDLPADLALEFESVGPDPYTKGGVVFTLYSAEQRVSMIQRKIAGLTDEEYGTLITHIKSIDENAYCFKLDANHSPYKTVPGMVFPLYRHWR